MYFDWTDVVMWFLLAVLFVVLAILLASLLPFAIETGYGTHTGYITAVGQESILGRNYSVWVKTDLASSQEDKYCVRRDDAGLAEDLRQLSVSRQRVTVSYRSVLAGATWGLFSDFACVGHIIVGASRP